MKIVAITSNTSWYLYNFRKNTILALISKGYKVFVVAPLDQYSSMFGELGAEHIHIDIDQAGMNPIHDLKTLIGFYTIYRKIKPDVVLNFTPKNNIYSTLVSFVLRIKIINNIAGLGSLFVSNGLGTIIARFLYKISQRYADKIFFQNEEDRALFLENKFSSIDVTERLPGSGVDLVRFSVTEAANDGVIRFLLIARMLFDKGIKQYVDAARELKSIYDHKAEFYLLGFVDANNPSAVSKIQMQEWVDEGIIQYLGVSDSVEDEIAKADCVVLPSYYREGVPKSLLEAGAMGKPIVTTDNVGCRETVEHGVNGFLCEPRSSKSLAHMLDKIICMSHEQRLIMGACSRRKMEREFDENIGINKYLSSIEELLS